jgi:hypothetical protein
MDKKVFDHNGYIRLDTATGIIEFIGDDDKVYDLTDETGAVKYFRGSIKFYEMSGSEVGTARGAFAMLGSFTESWKIGRAK